MTFGMYPEGRSSVYQYLDRWNFDPIGLKYTQFSERHRACGDVAPGVPYDYLTERGRL